MSKLFTLDLSNEGAEDINLSFGDVLAMEEHAVTVDNDVLALEELMSIYDTSILTVESLEKDLLSLESKDISPVDLNVINHRYITACANTGCTPITIAVEDGTNDAELSVEGIGEIIGKMKKAILTIIKKIIVAMKKLYAKILVAMNNDAKKAKLLLKEFQDKLDKDIIDPTEDNVNLTDSASNAIFSNLAAMMYFVDKDEPLSIMFGEYTDPRHNIILNLDKTFATLNDLKLDIKDLGLSSIYLDDGINNHITSKINFADNVKHYCTSLNGSSFGVLSLIYSDNNRSDLVDIKYATHTIKGYEGGAKSLAYVFKARTAGKTKAIINDSEFKIIMAKMPALDARSLRLIAGKIFITGTAIEDIQKTHNESTSDMESILKDIGGNVDDKERIKVLQKVILIQQQISTDQMIGLLKMNKAGLKLLSLQSYSFKK